MTSDVPYPMPQQVVFGRLPDAESPPLRPAIQSCFRVLGASPPETRGDVVFLLDGHVSRARLFRERTDRIIHERRAGLHDVNCDIRMHAKLSERMEVGALEEHVEYYLLVPEREETFERRHYCLRRNRVHQHTCRLSMNLHPSARAL